MRAHLEDLETIDIEHTKRNCGGGLDEDLVDGLHNPVEHTAVEGLGQSVPRVSSLVLVQRHVVHRAAATHTSSGHHAADQLLIQRSRVQAQKVGREFKSCRRTKEERKEKKFIFAKSGALVISQGNLPAGS